MCRYYGDGEVVVVKVSLRSLRRLRLELPYASEGKGGGKSRMGSVRKEQVFGNNEKFKGRETGLLENGRVADSSILKHLCQKHTVFPKWGDGGRKRHRGR